MSSGMSPRYGAPRRAQLHSSECECQPQHKESCRQTQTRGHFTTSPAHTPQEGCGQGAQRKAGGRFQARGDQGGHAHVTRGPRSAPRPGGRDESRARVGAAACRPRGDSGAASRQAPPYFWETHACLFRMKEQGFSNSSVAEKNV